MSGYKIVGNNINDKKGILNLLKEYVFGSDNLKEFNENTRYNKGDIVIYKTYYDDYKILTANEDGIKGPFISSQWTSVNLQEIMSIGFDENIIISEYKPNNSITHLWFQPIKTRTVLLREPEEKYVDPIPDDINSVGLVINNNVIPIVDNVETADLSYLNAGDLVIEAVNYSEGNIDESEIDMDVEIQTRHDYVVSDDTPSEIHPFLWIDTDTTDDDI